jgi:phosphonoacetate hydrolase
LEERLREAFGEGIRVICTITDPYVVHHGALGGFVVVHIENEASVEEVAKFCLAQAGVAEALPREVAAQKLELPADRLGDLIVLADRSTVLGRNKADHDLGMLDGVLRSHGSRYEEMVPFLLSNPLPSAFREAAWTDLRSFEIFQYLCPPKA